MTLRPGGALARLSRRFGLSRLLDGDRLALWSWRSLLVSTALLGTVVVSALGAWAVRGSWVDHQRAVEDGLEEYARYAALTFARELRTRNLQIRDRTLAPVTGGRAYDEPTLPLERLALVVGPILDAELDFATDPWAGYFRVDPVTGAYEATGRAADPAARAVITGLVRGQRTVLDTATVPLQAKVEVGGEEVTATYALRRTAAGAVDGVYGVTVAWERSGAVIARHIMSDTPLLSPSLTELVLEADPTARLDTIVAIRATWEDGRELFRTPAWLESDARGFYRAPGSPVTIHAVLHPRLAERLREVLLNDDRRRLQVVLPILSLVLAAVTILHLWRERELVRARRDFVASVSHELRTPLAQIRMFSETLLLGREESEEERLRWTAVIGREARRLGDLVENILLFSHIDASRVRLEPERTDIGELVEEAVEAYVPVAASRQMRIVADSPSRIYAVVDPRALRQVVVNLIDNALKYGPAGQTVSVEVEREGTWARLSVSDEGPGIPQADRARLWRPFVRLGKGGSTAGGSGIGLSVVRTLVTQHGGSVAVEDAPGRGARFVALLPLAGVGLSPFTGAYPRPVTETHTVLRD